MSFLMKGVGVMKFGLMVPNKGQIFGDPNVLLELSLMAEHAGWQGFFLWDHIGGGGEAPTVDPWICLGAIASQTKEMKIGTMVTPLARRRPWKVAREIVTLDHLSHGRTVLGVGLGDMVNKDFKNLGEVSNPRKRAEMLDESLEIIAGLQSGHPFNYLGRHYQVKEALFKPPAVQAPRIPVWVSAHWPFKRPLRRASRWDGVLPRQWNAGPITPQVISEIKEYISRHRISETPFEIIKYGLTEGKDIAKDRAQISEFATAGATWWIEEIYSGRGSLKKIKERIASGPPI
jgi:alkanesulfonate monooxygenase SsuD/methylene tetrahydromethanopterin reductase-like flavin-dependent oxidoreductase (luciferase family)